MLPVLIGIGISVYLIWQAFQAERYTDVGFGNGTHEFVDSNKNGIPEYSNSKEFRPSKDGSYSRITTWDELQNLTWGWHMAFWFLMACLMMVVRDVAYMIRLRILTDKKISWKRSFYVIMMWEFASALSPGVVGGAAVAMFIIRKEGINLGKSTAIVVSTAMLDNLFYLITVPLVILLVGANEFFPEIAERTLLGMDLNATSIFWFAYIVVFGFFLVLFLSLFFYPRLIKTILKSIFSLPVLRRWKQDAIQTGEDVIIASREFRTKGFKFWGSAFGMTFISWTGRFLVVNCLIQGIAASNLLDQAMIYARQIGMWVILLVSPTPGGSGVAELAFSEFLSDFLPFGIIALAGILWRLISYYPYLLIGSLILPGWLKRK
jgi:uncharacterized protein (TIRG00374 family)